MSKPMDKKSENQLLAAVKLVSASVEQGNTPNDAVVKIAGQMKLGRQMLPLVVNAYNVGRTTFQREHGGNSILDKQASFPIAHLETIVGQLYPSEPTTPSQMKVASGVDLAYSQPPVGPPRDEVRHMEKAAEVQLRMPEDQRPKSAIHRTDFGHPDFGHPDNDRYYGSPTGAIKKAFADRDRAARSIDESGHQYRMARDKYLAAMGAIGDYFKEAAPWRLPLAEVEWNAVQIFGEPAKHALDYVCERNGMQEKRASGPPSLLRAVDRNAPPYTLIKAAIDRGADLLAAYRADQREQKTATAQVETAFRPFVPSPSPSDPSTIPCSILGDSPEVSLQKEAGFLSNMMAMGIGAKMKGMDAPKDTGGMVSDVSQELSAPGHMQELQDIETRAMLTDFLHNDEVISGYDPEEVTSAFNEISKLSPRTASQPAVIRPLLRKQLTQGAMEPYEAQQIADIEKTVGQSQAPQVQEGMKLSEVLSGNTILH